MRCARKAGISFFAAGLRVPGRYAVYYLPDYLARPGRVVLHIEALAAEVEPR